MFDITITNKLNLINAPSSVIQQAIAANTFENPTYRSNLEHGRSNWNTEPLIKTFKYHDDGLILPLGYLKELKQTVKQNGEEFSIIDDRVRVNASFKSLRGVTLRPYQERAVGAALKHSSGTIVSPTGSGKSLIGLSIIQQQQQKTLILVHRTDLLKQWCKVIHDRLSVKPGIISGRDWNIDSDIVVGMIQTLSSRQEAVEEISRSFGLILVDECHHLPAQTFYDIIGNFYAKYRYGLSATPQRRDGLEPIIYRAVGSPIANIHREEVESIGATVPIHVQVINTLFRPTRCESWQDYQTALSTNEGRAELVVNMIQSLDEPTLCLVDRKEHAKYISKKLTEAGCDHVVAHGSLTKKNREQAMVNMKKSKITVGTTSLLGEGLDVPGWSNLILGSPISSEIKLLQAIGRVARAAPGKERAFAYDLRDDCAFSGASFNKRKSIYEAHNFFIESNRQQQATRN